MGAKKERKDERQGEALAKGVELTFEGYFYEPHEHGKSHETGRTRLGWDGCIGCKVSWRV